MTSCDLTIDVSLLPNRISNSDIAIGVDVLRASSSIVTALANGAECVIITSSVKKAKKLKKSIPNSILAGERNTVKIKGFDVGNSPSEMSKCNLRDKTVILTTTNGTKLLKKLKEHSKVVLTASVLNLSSIANTIREAHHSKGIKSVLIACAGVKGNTSIDDIAIAGLLIKEITKLTKAKLTDSAEISVRLFNSYRSIKEIFLNSESGRRVIAAGYSDDIDFCAQMNLYPLSPLLFEDTYLYLKTFKGLSALPL